MFFLSKDAGKIHVMVVVVGCAQFHGRMWKRKKDVYYDWVWQLSVFHPCFFEMIPNLCPMFFLNGGCEEKTPEENHKVYTPEN